MNAELERDFGDFVVGRAPVLCRFTYLLCGDWHQAEDVVQTAMAKLYLAWKRIHDHQSVDAYARKIILNVLASERRRAWFRRERSVSELPHYADGTDMATAAENRVAVINALALVPPRQRAVLVLRYWEDRSVEQVAEILGCSSGTVKSQSVRGLATLRRILDPAVPVSVGG